jgi:hypothetical protein
MTDRWDLVDLIRLPSVKKMVFFTEHFIAVFPWIHKFDEGRMDKKLPNSHRIDLDSFQLVVWDSEATGKKRHLTLKPGRMMEIGNRMKYDWGDGKRWTKAGTGEGRCDALLYKVEQWPEVKGKLMEELL